MAYPGPMGMEPEIQQALQLTMGWVGQRRKERAQRAALQADVTAGAQKQYLDTFGQTVTNLSNTMPLSEAYQQAPAMTQQVLSGMEQFMQARTALDSGEVPDGLQPEFQRVQGTFRAAERNLEKMPPDQADSLLARIVQSLPVQRVLGSVQPKPTKQQQYQEDVVELGDGMIAQPTIRNGQRSWKVEAPEGSIARMRQKWHDQAVTVAIRKTEKDGVPVEEFDPKQYAVAMRTYMQVDKAMREGTLDDFIDNMDKSGKSTAEAAPALPSMDPTTAARILADAGTAPQKWAHPQLQAQVQQAAQAIGGQRRLDSRTPQEAPGQPVAAGDTLQTVVPPEPVASVPEAQVAPEKVAAEAPKVMAWQGAQQEYDTFASELATDEATLHGIVRSKPKVDFDYEADGGTPIQELQRVQKERLADWEADVAAWRARVKKKKEQAAKLQKKRDEAYRALDSEAQKEVKDMEILQRVRVVPLPDDPAEAERIKQQLPKGAFVIGPDGKKYRKL